jgi:hypothetical protein
MQYDMINILIIRYYLLLLLSSHSILSKTHSSREVHLNLHVCEEVEGLIRKLFSDATPEIYLMAISI